MDYRVQQFLQTVRRNDNLTEYGKRCRAELPKRLATIENVTSIKIGNYVVDGSMVGRGWEASLPAVYVGRLSEADVHQIYDYITGTGAGEKYPEETRRDLIGIVLRRGAFFLIGDLKFTGKFPKKECN